MMYSYYALTLCGKLGDRTLDQLHAVVKAGLGNRGVRGVRLERLLDVHGGGECGADGRSLLHQCEEVSFEQRGFHDHTILSALMRSCVRADLHV